MRRVQHRTLGQRVVFDAGCAAEQVIAELDRLDARAVMVIAGQRQRDLLAGLADRTALLWTEVTQHVPVELAERARAAAADAGVDVIVAIGGGSAIGLAKAVALVQAARIVAVPTTYAGSEATNVWGLTEQSAKRTGVDDRVLPTTVVYDAELTASMPLELSVTSGLNAIAHCVESFWAPAADPINAAMASEGLQALRHGLLGIVDDPRDLVARRQLQYGSYLAAVAFASAGSGLHHKICHVLGGRFDLPHAATHSVVLPYVLAYNAPFAPAAAARVARALDDDDAVTGLERLRSRLNAPRSLRSLGLREEDLPAAVAAVLPVVPPSNPRPVDEDGLIALLRAAWAGADVVTAQRDREEQLTATVLASFADTPSPRPHTLVTALTTHLHDFAREVRLTEPEWLAAIEFLTATGHLTDDKRQEFILLSDVLGLSMQTITINHPVDASITESTVLGPFFVSGAPRIDNGADLSFGGAGEPCWVEGTVHDETGQPVSGARLEVWEADADGYYDVQYDDGRTAARAHLFTEDDGTFRLWALTPTPYPIPDDGPVGRLLTATARSPMRAPHLHFMVSAAGCATLITHIFVAGDDLGDDSVFGVRDSLIRPFERQQPGTPTPDGRIVDGSWTRVRFDIVLASESTVGTADGLPSGGRPETE